MQSVESVALNQYLRVLMETARTMALLRKGHVSCGIYYLLSTVMFDFVI